MFGWHRRSIFSVSSIDGIFDGIFTCFRNKILQMAPTVSSPYLQKIRPRYHMFPTPLFHTHLISEDRTVQIEFRPNTLSTLSGGGPKSRLRSAIAAGARSPIAPPIRNGRRRTMRWRKSSRIVTPRIAADGKTGGSALATLYLQLRELAVL